MEPRAESNRRNGWSMVVQEESEFSLLLDGSHGRAEVSPVVSRRDQPGAGFRGGARP